MNSKTVVVKGIPCSFNKQDFYRQVAEGYFSEEDEEIFTSEEVDELFTLGIQIYPINEQLELLDESIMVSLVSLESNKNHVSPFAKKLDNTRIQLNLFGDETHEK